MTNNRLDDKILELVCLADQIEAIALSVARAELQKINVDNLMYVIMTLSKQLSDKLTALSDAVEGVTV